LEELAEVGSLLKGLDPNAKDLGGEAPRERFNERASLPEPELRRSFEHFMRVVQGTLDNSDDEEHEDEDEVFFGARKVQEMGRHSQLLMSV